MMQRLWLWPAALLLALPAFAGTTVAFRNGELPQLHVRSEQGEALLSVLGPRLLHVSWGSDLPAGRPWLSPMLRAGTEGEPLSRPARWSAARRELLAGDLRVKVDGDCVQISGGPKARQALSRFCLASLGKSRLKLNWTADGYEQVVGLGQYLDERLTDPSWVGLQRRTGHAMGNAMTWSSVGASGNTQVPLAYVLGPGRTPFATFFDSPHALQFDFTGTTWTVEAAHGRLGMLLFPGDSLDQLRRQYLQLSGRSPVPPLKAFGLWLSEYGFDNWQELDDKLASLRQHGFPIDGAVLDLQWFGGISGGSANTAMGRLAWDTRAFPSARDRIASYAGQGLALMLIEESYVGAALPEHETLAGARLLAMNCLPPCTEPVTLDSNPWWGIGGMLDWSNPATGLWWHDHKRAPLIDDGILGHWTDLGEPEQFDERAVYHGYEAWGQHLRRHKDVHNLYNLMWSASIAGHTARTHPQRRPWILSRSGTAGSQRYGVALWSGDVSSSFAALQAHRRAQTNMSLSGFDYYGSDVGGFHRGKIDRHTLDQLYSHWLAGSSLMDVPLRPHVMNTCNCTETAPDRLGHQASNRAAVQLRYQLVPYLYSLAHAAWQTGEAVFPPLALHFPQQAGVLTVSSTKMIGPWLLFAPPVQPLEQQAVWLPAGRWTDFYQPGRVVQGTGAELSQPLWRDGLLRAPLFLREGAIVPMLREPPAHLGQLRPGHIRWFDDLLLRLVPSRQPSQFDLIEDDGISRGYEQGQLWRTRLQLQARADGGWQLRLRPDGQGGQVAMRRLTLEVAGSVAPSARLVHNGRTLPRVQDASDQVGWWPVAGGLRIHLGEVPVNAAQDIQLLPGN